MHFSPALTDSFPSAKITLIQHHTGTIIDIETKVDNTSVKKSTNAMISSMIYENPYDGT